MSRISLIVVSAFLAIASAPGNAAGLPPWEFGMTKEQVQGFESFGPYKSFGNGDLETYAGEFDGQKENVQFFFDGDGLRRIGVYMYEGKDAYAATTAWRAAHKSLEKLYGRIETPYMAARPVDKPPSEDEIQLAAFALVNVGVKVQMAPFEQPQGLFIFASLRSADVRAETYYFVTVYLDRPKTP